MDDNSKSNSSGLNITQFFVGAPSNDEIREFFLRQKRLADIKALENSPETSPELSESFEMYLQQRKQKLEEEKDKIRRGDKVFVASPISTDSLDDSAVADNTMNQCGDDSFLAMEKMCENTLHLNNESEILMDLTSMASPLKAMKKRSMTDETRLNDIEAPSFMFNNSSLISPNKHSPVIEFNFNRPSTILEVSEASSRTYQSSYRTAMTGTEASQYKTADESLTFTDDATKSRNLTSGDTGNDSKDDTGSLQDVMIKMPKIRSFYNDTGDMTKDSLEVTGQHQDTIDLTKDSLEGSSNDSSDKLNDTLEQIEYMLAQHQKMQAEKAKNLEPVTPKAGPVTPKVTPATVKSKPTPKTASKYSPLIKFSPVVRNSPAEPAFKKPTQSATKVPQFTPNRKYQHVESLVSQYINKTPEVPLQSKFKVLPGIGNNSPKTFNFRDSESFSKENEDLNGKGFKGSSLPMRAKTKSSAVTQIHDQRDLKKTPGGKMQGLLANTKPSVITHQGHVKARDSPKPFQRDLLNETALSEQSFADLSLFSGDVSVQVVEGVKRLK